MHSSASSACRGKSIDPAPVYVALPLEARLDTSVPWLLHVVLHGLLLGTHKNRANAAQLCAC
jgi:hypothetical protein